MAVAEAEAKADLMGNKGRLVNKGAKESNRNGIQCYHCKRYGHVKPDCWYKD